MSLRQNRLRSFVQRAGVELAFFAVIVSAVLMLLGFGVLVRELQEQADRNSTALKALCAQRADLDERIARTQKLLDETKGEGVIFAIPRRLIVDGQRQSRATRRNLDVLDC